MKRFKNFNLRFDRIKIQSIHIKTKHITSVIGDSGWPKYHLNITQRSPGYIWGKRDLLLMLKKESQWKKSKKQIK